MKEYETMKMYGKHLNTWKHTVASPTTGFEHEKTVQVEVAYKVFNHNGEPIHEGSEDFSFQRWDSSTARYEIWTWDGQKLNKGGYRWFECVRQVRINIADRKKLTDLAAKWYPKAAAISIRKR